jgi:hypothetical protein
MTVQVQEFSSAEALMAHYRALDARKKAQQMRAATIAARTRLRLVEVKPAPQSSPAAQAPEVQAEPEGPPADHEQPIGPRPVRDWLWIGGLAPSKRIMKEVCEKYGVRLADLKSCRRTRNLVIPRHEVSYRLRMETGLSMPAIGRLLDRDHTTILHGVKAYERRLAEGTVSL